MIPLQLCWDARQAHSSSTTTMPDSIQRRGSVAALRKRGPSPRVQKIRLAAFRTLIAVALVAAATGLLSSSSHLRAWAGVIAIGAFVGTAIAWLAGTSGRIDGSGEDPQDFTIPE